MTSERWETIERIFVEATTLPESDRARFLDFACRDDAELRESVDSMLAFDEDNFDWLAAVVENAAAELAGMPNIDYAGALVGRYRIEERLGQGGMGTVWLASREGADFEQRVAIKFLATPIGGMVEGFRTERKILAQLNHPNIALMLDGDVTPEGT